MENSNIFNFFKPNEIAFLNYVDGLPKDNVFPEYWKISYGINFKTIFDKFLNHKLLTYEYDPKTSLMRKYIPELKEFLKEYNLPVNGKKEILVDRIINNIDSEILQKKLNNQQLYKITQKGLDIINKFYLFIINIKGNYNFTDFQMLNIYKQFPDENNTNKLLIYLLNEDIARYKDNLKWGNLQTRTIELAKLYFKLDEFSNALKYYIYNFKLILYNMQNDNYLSDVSNIYISVDYLKELKSIINITNIDRNALLEHIKNDNLTINIPFKYFDDNEILKILCDLLEDKEFNVKNYSINIPNRNSKTYKYYGYYDNEKNIFSTQVIYKSNSNNNLNFIDKFFDKIINKTKEILSK